jgi:hypothetical protein
MFAARLVLTETGAARVKPGFALGEFLFSKSEHEKTDAEAVQDWESEGGVPLIYTKKLLPKPSRR